MSQKKHSRGITSFKPKFSKSFQMMKMQLERLLRHSQGAYPLIFLVLALAMATSNIRTGAAQEAFGFIRRVQVFESDETGLSSPAGLAYSPRANAFLVIQGYEGGQAPANTEVVQLTPFGGQAGSLRIAAQVENPINVAFDNFHNRLLILRSTANQLISVPAGPDGVLDPGALLRYDVRDFGLQDPQGMITNPGSDDIYILDANGPRLVQVKPGNHGNFDDAVITVLDLQGTDLVDPRGLAFEPTTGHLFMVNPAEQELYEMTQTGQVVTTRDLSEFGISDPKGLVFAPSGDQTDDPAEMSLYLADRGRVTQVSSGHLIRREDRLSSQSLETSTTVSQSDGQIMELSLAPLAAPAIETFTSVLVNEVDLSKISPPSPDSSGLAYVSSSNHLVMDDGEVEETVGGTTHFEGTNVWEMTLSGSVVDTANISSVPPIDVDITDEPTGIAWNPANGHYFFVQDDGDAVFELDPGADGWITSGDSWTSFDLTGQNSDGEGLAFDSWNNHIFVADGVNAEVYEYTLSGSLVNQFDVEQYGVADPESVEFNPLTGTLFVMSSNSSSPVIVETTTSGDLLQTIDISAAGARTAAGLAYAPASDGLGEQRFYIVDRGVDNNSDPNIVDGKMYELTAPASITEPVPPIAHDDFASTVLETPITIDVVANDTDPNGDLDPTSAKITCGACAGPSNGSLQNNLDGTFTYTAMAGFIGTDNFVYDVCDTEELCDTATASIDVTGPTIEVRVSASTDDAEEASSGGMDLGSSDLELVLESSVQTVGIRFNGISVPQGANILNAYLQFQTDEENTEATALIIQGEDVDQATTFTSTSGNISSRPRTTASTSWSPPPWTIRGEAGPDQRTPDISPVIQEIVGRPGWANGNSLVIIITGSGKRVAESFDGSQTGAPTLYVEYATGGAPLVAISAPTDGASFPDGGTVNFAGTAMDAQDGNLTASLLWESSLDGVIGTGGSFSRSDLSVGIHTITASVEDSSGLNGFGEVGITIVNNPPDVPAIVSPTDGATSVSTSPSLEVNVSDPEGDDLTVTFYGRPATPVSDSDFTLIAMPDTQHYTDDPANYANFSAQTQWIVDNQDSLNIPFVTHLGDVVQNGDNFGDTTEWEVADAAMSLLEDPVTTQLVDGIPYGVAPGNHDQGDTGDGDADKTVLFNTYFGIDRFLGRSYYGGYYGTDNLNDDNYELFSASGMDFIIIHFEYTSSPPQAVLDWADNLLKTYSHRRAIVTTHNMVRTGDPAPFSTQGQKIYDALKDNPNLFLLLGGHNPGEGQRVDVYNGNTIYSLCSDYQSRSNGGNGWLRMMEFSPVNNEIQVKTYSPVLDQFETDADSQFTLPYEMGGLSFQVLGTNTNIPSGSNTSITWPNLVNGIEYEWYATVDDGNNVTTGTTWSFTTGVTANDPPMAVDDSYSINEDTLLSVAAPGVLSNDTDADGDTLTAVLNDSTSNGSLTLNADGSFIYNPNANFNGGDSFTYHANDSTADSNVVTVSITVNPVNDPPVAVDDSATTSESSPVMISVLTNDNDPDGDTLAVSSSTQGSNGTVVINADNTITYTPSAGFNGSDAFTYTASDGMATSNNAMVTITVNPVNDAPVAVGDAYTTDEDTVLTVPAPGALGNDTDADGDPLTAALDTAPANGSLTLNADGSFSYTPDANFHGGDSFTYHANDGTTNSNVATVSITVNTINDSPMAVDDAYTTSEDTPLNIATPGVLDNDSDVDGDTLSAVLDTGPANGTLTLTADGSFTYTPNANFDGSDSFSYHASDGIGDSNSATVTITVNPINDAPVATVDTNSTDEDTLLTVAAPGVLGNDSDVDGDPLTAVLDTGPTHGTLTLNANGSFTYMPNADFNGPDGFSYHANDGAADSNVASVTITVNAGNDAPVAVDDTYTTDEDTPLNVSAQGVLGNDSDIDSDSLTAVLDTSPTNGNLTFNSDGSFTYTPNENFNGADSFTYHASDGTANSNLALVTITINPVNDAPVVTITTPTNGATFNQGESINFSGNAIDVEEGELTANLTWSSDLDGLIGSSGSFSTTLSNGTHTITASVSDSTGLEGSTQIVITVSPPTLTLLPSDDASVYSNDPASNFGSAQVLELRDHKKQAAQSYLKFDVNGLNFTVNSVTLRLYSNVGSNSVVSVYLVTDNSWTENGIAWNNAPGVSGTSLATLNSIASGAWAEFDLTPTVTSDGVYSFVLTGSSPNWVNFNSKEAVDFQPTLVISP
jgi:VCBS repeat-containing protein